MMSVILLSWFEEPEVIFIFLRFLVLCNDSTKKNKYEIFSEEKQSQEGQKK